MKKLLVVGVVVCAGYVGLKQYRHTPLGSGSKTGSVPTSLNASTEVFDASNSGCQIQGNGIVIKLLPDDNDGSHHQRLIVKLGSGQTLLIAHNIDLAPRINGLQMGDSVGFNGQYEWNSKGGVVHWTHRDPGGRHAAGWLKHRNQIYQ